MTAGRSHFGVPARPCYRQSLGPYWFPSGVPGCVSRAGSGHPAAVPITLIGGHRVVAFTARQDVADAGSEERARQHDIADAADFIAGGIDGLGFGGRLGGRLSIRCRGGGCGRSRGRRLGGRIGGGRIGCGRGFRWLVRIGRTRRCVRHLTTGRHRAMLVHRRPISGDEENQARPFRVRCSHQVGASDVHRPQRSLAERARFLAPAEPAKGASMASAVVQIIRRFMCISQILLDLLDNGPRETAFLIRRLLARLADATAEARRMLAPKCLAACMRGLPTRGRRPYLPNGLPRAGGGDDPLRWRLAVLVDIPGNIVPKGAVVRHGDHG